MTESDMGHTEGAKEAELSRQDWRMLPLLSLLTIVVIANAMSITARLIARQAHFEASGSMLPCLVLGDLSTGVRGIPGTVCTEKYHEDSQPVEYRFNSSGYRADVPFGPKKQGTYRIVVVGSSFAMGMHVPAEKTFTALLPGALSSRTGRNVEVFNEGMHTGFAGRVALSLNDALAVEPDMILWVLTVHDVKGASVLAPESVAMQDDLQSASASIGPTGPLSALKTEFIGHPPLDAIRELWNRSEESFVLLHYVYESQSLYLNSSLMPGRESDYLRVNPSAEWQSKLTQFANYSAKIESKARGAGVPLVAVYFPLRAPAAMVSIGQWPKGFDPYKFDDELRSIITSQGATYIDILPDFRSIPNPEQNYLPIDGHPTAAGHGILTELLAKELTSGAVPALRATGEMQTAPQKGN